MKSLLTKPAFLLITPFILATLVYWPGLGGPFVFDDLTNILLNKKLYLKEFNFQGLYNAFTSLDSESTLLYRPLSMLSFAINFYFFEHNQFSYKFINLLIHFCNSALIYILFFRILSYLNKTNRLALPLDAKLASWILAVIWLLHPLNLDSVLYVVQRMNSLSATGILLGLVAYTHLREKIADGNYKDGIKLLAAPLLLGALAALFKENGVLLVAYIFVIELLVFQFSVTEKNKRYLYAFYSLYFIVPIISLILAVYFKPSLLGLHGYAYRDFSLTERLLTESRVLWFYLQLILAPAITKMGLYHDDIAISSHIFESPITLIAAISWPTLTGLSFYFRKRFPVPAFCILWFIAGHSLESTIVPLEIAYEHRNYLPMAGPLAGALYFIYWLAHKYKQERIMGIFVVTFLLFIAMGTFIRANYWSSEWTLYNSDVANNPNSARAQTNMGILLHDNKMFNEALPHFLYGAKLETRGYGHHLQLVQALATSGRKIENSTLDELERRTKTFAYSPNTIWAFEPAFSQLSNQPAAQARILEIFKNIINSERVELPPQWKEKAYHIIANTHEYRKEHGESLVYRLGAMSINPSLSNKLFVSEVYIELKKYEDATSLLKGILSSEKNKKFDQAKPYADKLLLRIKNEAPTKG